jgi:hypothetical protein
LYRHCLLLNPVCKGIVCCSCSKIYEWTKFEDTKGVIRRRWVVFYYLNASGIMTDKDDGNCLVKCGMQYSLILYIQVTCPCRIWRRLKTLKTAPVIFCLPKAELQIYFIYTLARRVPLVEQELLTLPEHLNSPSVFSGVRVTRSLVLYNVL